jgi:ABC-type multidrug transport system fused ATPase/permease subunit
MSLVMVGMFPFLAGVGAILAKVREAVWHRDTPQVRFRSFDHPPTHPASQQACNQPAVTAWHDGPDAPVPLHLFKYTLSLTCLCGQRVRARACAADRAQVTVSTTNRINEAYTNASSGVQQSLTQIRTVAAYGGEERSLASYADALIAPTRINVRQSLTSGVALGSVNAILYFTYAAAFYYGTWRVSTGYYTGGQVMQVILLGSFGVRGG